MSEKKEAAKFVVCPSCGSKNPEGVKFCNECGAKLQVAVSERKEKVSEKRGEGAEVVVCFKCGTANPRELRFCNNCGARLQVGARRGLEGLVSLHVVAALYVLLSVLFNALVQASTLLLVLYLAAGVLGIFGAYALNAGKKWGKFVSVAMVGCGVVGTFLMFLIGLGLSGIVGPGWVIFVVTAGKLWQDRYRL